MAAIVFANWEENVVQGPRLDRPAGGWQSLPVGLFCSRNEKPRDFPSQGKQN